MCTSASIDMSHAREMAREPAEEASGLADSGAAAPGEKAVACDQADHGQLAGDGRGLDDSIPAGSLADEVAGLRAGLSSIGSRLDSLEEECRRLRRSRSRSPRTPTQQEARLEGAEARLRTLEASFRELLDFWSSFKSVVGGKCDLQAAAVAALEAKLSAIPARLAG